MTSWNKNDITKLSVLQRAKVKKARQAYITTNHDLSNLNAMITIQELDKEGKKNFSLFCHLGDLKLHQNFGETIFKEDQFADEHVRYINPSIKI